VLYFTDVGHSAMSCDACHLEGHTMNVFFAKTFPLRIYRSPTLRGVRETPPYFTPASARSLAETTIEVGGRNRYHNPDPSPSEVEALSLFTSEVAPLPNPYRDANGAPPATLELPDGKTGSTRRGRELFLKGCAGCHPAPLFTTDQDAPTRGRFLDVGTPHALPLREAMQDTTFKGFAPPSLLGAWDVFPMLTTGSAGLEVREDGTLHARDRFPLRAVLERYSGPSHGNAESLTQQERDDLLAWLLTL
jgi:cytochrome c peroxidase